VENCEASLFKTTVLARKRDVEAREVFLQKGKDLSYPICALETLKENISEKYVLTEWRKKRYQNHERGTLEGKEQAFWSKEESLLVEW
jgi:hypothetical protein